MAGWLFLDARAGFETAIFRAERPMTSGWALLCSLLLSAWISCQLPSVLDPRELYTFMALLEVEM
jgi:hypothetical protein